jgi:hypothetical protein
MFMFQRLFQDIFFELAPNLSEKFYYNMKDKNNEFITNFTNLCSCNKNCKYEFFEHNFFEDKKFIQKENLLNLYLNQTNINDNLKIYNNDDKFHDFIDNDI